MIMTPLALAMAMGTAVFPTLSEASALETAAREFEQVFQLSLRMILFLTIPASVGLMVLGEPVIRLFFERDQFNAESTSATAYALVFFAIGLAGHATVEIVDRVFYALHDTRSPVLVAVSAIGLNVVLSLVLMQTPLNYGGLALANSIAALMEATILISPRCGAACLTCRSTTWAPRPREPLAASLVMGLPGRLAGRPAGARPAARTAPRPGHPAARSASPSARCCTRWLSSSFAPTRSTCLVAAGARQS